MEPLADGKGPIIWLKSTQDGRTLYCSRQFKHRGDPAHKGPVNTDRCSPVARPV